MWDTAQAKDKMDAWLSGPNANKIEVVIANNDAMAMGAVEALKAHNKSSIPVFGVDALPEAPGAGEIRRDGRYCAERCQQPGKSDLRAGEKPLPTGKTPRQAPTGKLTTRLFASPTWASIKTT